MELAELIESAGHSDTATIAFSSCHELSVNKAFVSALVCTVTNIRFLAFEIYRRRGPLIGSL